MAAPPPTAPAVDPLFIWKKNIRSSSSTKLLNSASWNRNILQFALHYWKNLFYPKPHLKPEDQNNYSVFTRIKTEWYIWTIRYFFNLAASKSIKWASFVLHMLCSIVGIWDMKSISFFCNPFTIQDTIVTVVERALEYCTQVKVWFP